LKKLATQRETQRKSRANLFKIALVGYTNAGKSTLFNVLTKAGIQTADKLFTTLDSTTRVMSAGYPTKVVFSDTVGFIRKLPHQLVESFKSTLEEVALADLLLHVADCSDPKLTEQIEQTQQVLTEIGADRVPYLMVYNKLDSNPEFLPPSDNTSPGFAISALKNLGLPALKAEVVARSARRQTR
jgi:GTP-binding protein HflX